ncbi:integrase [Gordonia phage OneUp]|uniref:Integrase n=1 Tax=Gordonia phage OneUp TaxID=1838074 RepID=A0A160DEV1_9CAUD|nr:integrase [Gordonia phage OneUp]ANA86408.1 integrase [Gordonia phage OneUp]
MSTDEEKKERRRYGQGSTYYREERDVWVASKRVGYDNRGKPIRLSAQGKTEAKAIAKLDKKIRDFRLGKQTSKSKGTVGEYLDRWLSDVIADDVRPTTLHSYDSSVRNQIKPTIGTKKLAKLTPEDVRQMRRDIEAMYTEKARADPRYAETGPKRSRYAQVVLSKALADAVREEIIDRNVADTIYVKKPPATDKEQPALNAEQAKRLLRVALEKKDRWATRWAVALLTGVRQGETLGLTWDRVNFERKEILFDKQLQVLQNRHGCGTGSGKSWPCGMKVARACPHREYVIQPQYRNQVRILEEGKRSLALTPTKTKMSKRALPMSEPLEKILRAHKLSTMNESNPHNLVFHYEDGRPVYPRDDYDNWLAALDAADLERIKLHSTRHSTASIMSDMGIDRQVIMQILGHTNLNTTARYAAVGDTFRREAMESLSNLLDMFGEGDAGNTPALDV